MPEICGAFYKKYPQVGVTVDVGNIGGLQQLLEKLKKGALDLVLGYDYDENEFEGIPLHNERLIFVIHKDTQGAAVLKKYAVTREEILSKSFSTEKELEDFSVFRDVKFVKNRETSNVSQRMRQMLGECNLVPHVVINL